jgi:hypothetical protein
MPAIRARWRRDGNLAYLAEVRNGTYQVPREGATCRHPLLDLRTSDLIQHVRERRKSGAGPATVNNDLIWLRIILRYARAAWGLPFDLNIVDDACEIVKAEKLIATYWSGRMRRASARSSPQTDGDGVFAP